MRRCMTFGKVLLPPLLLGAAAGGGWAILMLAGLEIYLRWLR